MSNLLLVDADRLLLRILEKLLVAEGHICLSVETTADAQYHLNRREFDMIVLDVNLPDQDGFAFCRHLRTQHRIPILFFTDRKDTMNMITGLEAGADDYIVKPSSQRELIARIRAQLRRFHEYNKVNSALTKASFGELIVDFESRHVFRKGVPIYLAGREFELLHLLARHSGKALSREWIFEQMWGDGRGMCMETLTACIYRLRLKIEYDPEQPSLLLTVRGFGYKLTCGQNWR